MVNRTLIIFNVAGMAIAAYALRHRQNPSRVLSALWLISLWWLAMLIYIVLLIVVAVCHHSTLEVEQ